MNISSTKARSQFSELINLVSFGKQRIRVARQGKSLVAMIPIEDLEKLEYLEDQIDILQAGKEKKCSLKAVSLSM